MTHINIKKKNPSFWDKVGFVINHILVHYDWDFCTDVCSLPGTVGGLPSCLCIRVHGETGTY